MKLEELLQAIIDKQYPKGFLSYSGVCANVRFLLGYEELFRLEKAIAALYKEVRFPVAGLDEYNTTLGTDMYESGLRAKFCARVLKYLKANRVKKFYLRVFRDKRYTEAYPASPNNSAAHTNPANQGVET